MKLKDILLFSGAAVLAFNVSALSAMAYDDNPEPLEKRIHQAMSQGEEDQEPKDYEMSGYWTRRASARIQEVLSGKEDGPQALDAVKMAEDFLVWSTKLSGQPAAWEDLGSTASQINELKVKNHMAAFLVYQGWTRQAENRKLVISRDGTGDFQSLALMKIAEDHLKQAVSLSGKTEQELFERNFSSIGFNYHDFKIRKATVLSEAAAAILEATDNARLKNAPLMIRDAGDLLQKANQEAAKARELTEQYLKRKQAEPPAQIEEEYFSDCLSGYQCM